jgi:hypothetical protein
VGNSRIFELHRSQPLKIDLEDVPGDILIERPYATGKEFVKSPMWAKVALKPEAFAANTYYKAIEEGGLK